MAVVNVKSFISKAAPEDLLCHGLKCSLRDRCKRYNLEPNPEQKWMAGYPQTIGKNTVLCTELEMITEIKKEEN